MAALCRILGFPAISPTLEDGHVAHWQYGGRAPDVSAMESVSSGRYWQRTWLSSPNCDPRRGTAAGFPLLQ